MNLGQSIASLLFDHDCVIVPEFGGIVANTIPASIHPRLQTISPPSKQLTFNRNLTHNDGLLVNHLSREYSWEYAIAMQNLRNEVGSLLADLDEGKRINWEGVGIIYKTAGGQMHFLPDEKANYLQDAFGFETIMLPAPIEKAAPMEETKVIPITPADEAIESEPDAPQKSRRWIAAAVLLPLIVAGTVWGLNKLPENKTLSLARFNPLKAKTVAADYQTRFPEEALVLSYDQVGNAIDKLASENPDLNSVRFSFTNDEMAPDGIKVALKRTPLTEFKNEVDTESIGAKKMELYFIVGGAFKNKSNADKMVASLRQKGYDASIFGKKRNLHMVCYGVFSDEGSARAALVKVKSTEHKKAWIKRHGS